MTRLAQITRPASVFNAPPDRWQIAAALVFALMVVLPVLALLTAALLPASGSPPVAGSVGTALRAMAGSLSTAAASMGLGVVFGVLLGEATRRSEGRLAAALHIGTLLPLVVPPVVFAVGTRLLFESAGLARLTTGDASAVLSTLPLVLAQSCVTVAIVAIAWNALRSSRASRVERARQEAASILGLPPLERWGMVERPAALRALTVGALLAFVHAFASLAAPAIFQNTGVPSLPLALHRTLATGLAGVAAVLPMLVTLPMLALALQRRQVEPLDEPESDARHIAGRGVLAWSALGLLVLTPWVVAPLLVVFVYGFSPESVGALMRGDGGFNFSAAFGASLLFALVAAMAALLPLAYAPSSVPLFMRSGPAPWVLLAVPAAPLAAASAGWFGTDAWLVGAAAVHAALGYAAALPVLATLSDRQESPLDVPRVLGADGLQPIFWGDRSRFQRTVLGAVLLAVLASLGDVGAVPFESVGTARTLGQAFPTFFATAGSASTGAYAIATLLLVVGAGGLALLSLSRVTDLAIWARR